MGIVITGPTGAIGMALIKRCLKENKEVLAICHKGSSRIGQIPADERIRVVEADLVDYADLNLETNNEYDTFIHLAWNGTFGDTRNDMKLQSENIRHAIDAVELANRLGCKNFIGAGSQAEYGRVDKPLRPDTPAFPENGYGIAKLAAGQMTRIRCEQLGIKHIWVRIFSVYGPYDGEYTMVMSTLKKMIAGEETHFTAGDQIWDYLYSEDAADMILNLADNAKHGTIYCIASGDTRPLKEYIHDMYEATDCKARLGLGDIPYNDKQVMCLCVDKDHILQGNRTAFRIGIRNTIEYLKIK
ncbi:MAG: NAD-dependent epimerase/dehydratase family protein [Lachnospiraceae bacterium]|nr:NAD-dependent epimerase/dehydratase family protein [Lachnospiraceae bacterium]